MEQSESVPVRWLAAGDRGDVEAFDALMHPDAVTTTSRDAEKQVWLDAVPAMPDLRADGPGSHLPPA